MASRGLALIYPSCLSGMKPVASAVDIALLTIFSPLTTPPTEHCIPRKSFARPSDAVRSAAGAMLSDLSGWRCQPVELKLTHIQRLMPTGSFGGKLAAPESPEYEKVYVYLKRCFKRPTQIYQRLRCSLGWCFNGEND